MKLQQYLQRTGVTSGPLVKNTSYSRLSNNRILLLGGVITPFNKDFLVFGSALHELFLENKKAEAWETCIEEERTRITYMVAALNRHPVVRRLMADSIREHKFYFHWDKVEMAVILDIKKPPVGADLKSTTCRTLPQFVAKARELGYFKQAVIYMRAAKLKDFYFIAVQKSAPYDVMVLDVNQYKEDLRYAEAELDWLLYFYEHYGNIGETKTIIKPKMSMKSKDAMAAINELAKDLKTKQFEAGKAAKTAAKAALKLAKAIERFPKNDRELYSEKLSKASALLS